MVINNYAYNVILFIHTDKHIVSFPVDLQVVIKFVKYTDLANVYLDTKRLYPQKAQFVAVTFL